MIQALRAAHTSASIIGEQKHGVMPGRMASVMRRGISHRAVGSKRSAFHWTLFVLLVLDVSRLHQHYPALAVLRPMQLLTLGTFAIAFFKPHLVEPLHSWFRTWPARVVAALGVVACLSAMFGISLGGSARFILEDYSKTLILAFLVMASIRNARDLAFFAWAYVIACGVLVWMATFVFGMSKADPAGIYRLSHLYTYDANDLGVVLLAGLGLCFFTFQTSRGRGKVASIIIMAGIGYVMARSGSRGGFVGLMAFSASFLLLPAKMSLIKRIAAIGLVGVALHLGSPEGYWQQMMTVFSPKEDYNWDATSGRRLVAKRGMGYMLKHPLFGVGINNFPRAEGTLSEVAKNWTPNLPGVRWVAAHNSYVQVGAELGVLGLILWSSLIVGGVVASLKMRRRLRGWSTGDEQQRLVYQFSEWLPRSLIGFGVAATFVSFGYLDPVYILAAYIAGLYIARSAALKGDVPASVPLLPGNRHTAIQGTRRRRSDATAALGVRRR